MFSVAKSSQQQKRQEKYIASKRTTTAPQTLRRRFFSNCLCTKEANLCKLLDPVSLQFWVRVEKLNIPPESA